MKKPKLLHIMMGHGNPNMQRGLESVFECKHIDWTEVFEGVASQNPPPEQQQAITTTETMRRVHGFDIRNPSGEARADNRVPLPVQKIKTNILTPSGEPSIDNRIDTGSTITKKSPFDSILLKAFNDFKPDVVFMHLQRPGIISHESLDAINKKSVVVNWCGDVREELPKHYIDLGHHIDLTLFTNIEDVEKLRKAGVKAEFLQVGYDSQNFNPKGPVDTKMYPEIIFMGSNYQNTFPLSSYREAMVQKLKATFGDKFGVYGANWGQYANGLITNFSEEGKAYRSCKIAISLSHFERTKYASDRLFRILGTGAFCLTHTFPDIEHDFEIGKDLDVFTSIEQLVTKIKYYLENETLRKSIAESGQKKAKMNFTWHNFAENLKVLTDKIQLAESNDNKLIKPKSEMKQTLFYFGTKQIFEQDGNYSISAGESIVLEGKNYYVTSIQHNFDTKYKVVVLTNLK